ncbi:MAG: two-component system, sensor histidine kinase and response regulator [Desulfovibrionales bacterium]|nr:two-component system, sensor histidine kinase and response regulator [Desulfovibrionales bacterium]
MSIKGRLISHFVGLAGAPLLLTALVLAWQGMVMLHDQAEVLLNGAANSAVHRVESYVASLKGELSLAARLVTVDAPKESDWTASLQVLLHAGQQQFFGLAILDENGKVVAQAGKFYGPGLSRKLSPGAMPATAGMDEGTPVLTIAEPLGEGHSGYLAGSAPLQLLTPLFEDLSRQCQGEVMLENEAGLVFLQPGGGEHALDSEANLLQALDIASRRKVKEPNAGLVVTAKLPWTVAFQPAIRAALITAIALFLSLGVSALLAVFASQRIIEPLQSLAQAAKRLQNGDLSARVQAEGSDELATTSQAFNAMASKLSKSLDGLREQVAIREKMEDRLRASEATARALINASIEAAFLLDENYLVLTANPVGAEFYGQRISDMEHRFLKDFLPPENFEQLRAKADQALQNGRPVRFEQVTAGRIFDILLSPIQGREAKEDRKLAVFSRDITTTRLAEQAQLLHKTRLEALVALARMTDASHRQIADFALEKAIQLTNSKRGFLSLRDEATGDFSPFAFSQGAIEDCKIADKTKSQDCGQGGLWAEAIRRKEPIIVNNYQPGDNALPEGHVTIERLIAAPVMEGEKVTALVGVSDKEDDYDVTDSIQLMLLMEGMMQHLRRISAAQELQRARDEALAANDAKGKFLAHMSHEIRTPLQGVIGIIESSLRFDAPPELARNLDLVRDASHSMLTIVNDILDFSRIEAGKLDLVDENVDLPELLDNVIGLFNLLANDKDVQLRARTTSEAPRLIRTDPDRLRQILANLVSNAVKFTEHGEVEIVAQATSQIREGRVELALSVRDTGPGIPEAEREAIFEAFQQAGPYVAKRYGGTGLGLAICARLAKLMHGDLTVKSTVGEGSTFTFRAEFEVPDPEIAEDASPEPPDQTPELPTLRILLAEDTLINQVFIEDLLTREGHGVTVADNGVRALEALEKERFDVVLMDVQMPEMDGLEATRRIRESGVGPNPADLPIVALTAYAMESDRKRILEAGVDEYLSKPVQVDELMRVMAKAVGATPDATPTVQLPSPPADSPADFLDELAAEFDPETVRDLLGRFERNCDAWLQAMDQALETDDFEALSSAARDWAEQAGNLRAMDATEAARRVQLAAEQGRKQECRATLGRLHQTAASLLEKIRSRG